MTFELWWPIGAIALLLLMSAFFSGSETALTAFSRANMHRLAARGSARAQTVLNLAGDGERLLGAILLGNNLINILATSMATSLFITLFGKSGVALATLAMTILILIFAEVLPKTYAITRPETAALMVASLIAVVVRLLAPFVAAVRLVVRASLHLFGVKADPNARILTAQDEIRGTIDMHHSEGGVVKGDRDMLLGALDLKNREIDEVMMHRRNILTLDSSAPPQELIKAILQSPYTRIPLWRDEVENIVGVIHAKDLLSAVDALIRNSKGGLESIKDLDIMSIAMEPWFVPDTTTLYDQLQQFLSRRSHFALVVDEYGALQGLITLEDILEEIVGDICDEHDLEAEGVTREPDGSFIVDGATTIRDLNRLFDWDLPDEEVTTIAGLAIHEARTIPTAGQVFVFHGFRFEILARERHQITKLRLRRMKRV